jgi:hypothetical protein
MMNRLFTAILGVRTIRFVTRLTGTQINRHGHRIIPALLASRNPLSFILALWIIALKGLLFITTASSLLTFAGVFWYIVSMLASTGHVSVTELIDFLRSLAGMLPDSVSEAQTQIWKAFNKCHHYIWEAAFWAGTFFVGSVINHAGQIWYAMTQTAEALDVDAVSVWGIASGVIYTLFIHPIGQTWHAILEGNLVSLAYTGVVSEVLSWPVNLIKLIAFDLIVGPIKQLGFAIWETLPLGATVLWA